MLNLLEPNKNYKNLKVEIAELFSFLSPYTISSIYGETLRGQIKKREIKKESKEKAFKWKKLYYKNPKDKNKYKRYLIKLPNFLEAICPEEINSLNIYKTTEEINKLLALICREKAYEFEKNHSLTILLLWEKVGRYRTIEKKYLIEEIKKYANIEQKHIDEVLKDLTDCGFIVKLRNEYGIRKLIKL